MRHERQFRGSQPWGRVGTLQTIVVVVVIVVVARLSSTGGCCSPFGNVRFQIIGAARAFTKCECIGLTTRRHPARASDSGRHAPAHPDAHAQTAHGWHRRRPENPQTGERGDPVGALAAFQPWAPALAAFCWALWSHESVR
jgi:hypothetical protein